MLAVAEKHVGDFMQGGDDAQSSAKNDRPRRRNEAGVP